MNRVSLPQRSDARPLRQVAVRGFLGSCRAGRDRYPVQWADPVWPGLLRRFDPFFVSTVEQPSARGRTMLPEGFTFTPEFISTDEEHSLLEEIRRRQFSDVRMRGVTARRRVVHYGWIYRYESFQIAPGPPVPQFLEPVRARAAALVQAEPTTLAEILVTEYPPGATIGWHRDAPAFGIVVALSLAGTCRLRFRREQEGGYLKGEMELPPRSAYVLSGPARTQWQHSIPAVRALRYSITFRTLRPSLARSAS